MASEMVDVQIMHRTRDGVLVGDGDQEVWLPIEAIENWDDDWGPGDHVSIDIPVSLAMDRGLV